MRAQLISTAAILALCCTPQAVEAGQTQVEYVEGSGGNSCNSVCSGVSKSCVGRGSSSTHCGRSCTSGNCQCSVAGVNYWVYRNGFCWESWPFSCSQTTNSNAHNCCKCAVVQNIAPTISLDLSSLTSVVEGSIIILPSGQPTIADADAGSGLLTLTISATDSVIAGLTTSVPDVTLQNNATSTVTVEGTLTNLRDAMVGAFFIPPSDFFGQFSVTMQIDDNGNSDGDAETASITRAINVADVNDPPTLDSISSLTISEDAGTQQVALTGITAGSSYEHAQSLVVTATSSDTAIVPDPVVDYTSPATSGMLRLTPVANAFGSVTITVQVEDSGDSGSNTVSVTFSVTISSVNDPPTIDSLSDMTVSEDSGSHVVAVSGITSGNSWEQAQQISLSATSSDTSIIPNPVISYTSPQSTASLTFTPVAEAHGIVTIDVTVQDNGGGSSSTSETFSVTVTSVNDPPTLDSISSLTISEDAGTQQVALTGISAGSSNEHAQSLAVTAVSSDTAIVPDPVVNYTSPATSGMLRLTPVANAFGSVTITVYVKDNGDSGSNTVSVTFSVTISSVNDPPTIDFLSDMAVSEDSGPHVVAVSGITSGNSWEQAQQISLSATSSDTSIIPNPVISYTSPQSTANLTFTPVAEAHGIVTIDVTVQDNGGGSSSTSETFSVTVTSVNDPPFMNSVSDLTIAEDSGQHTVALSGIGASESGQSISISVASSDSDLIANPIVSYVSPSSTGQIQFQPQPNAFGDVNMTVTISDDGGTHNSGINSAVYTFLVSITPINDVPTLATTANSPIQIQENADEQILYLFNIGAGNQFEADQSVTVTALCNDTQLVPQPTVTRAPGSSTGLVSFQPAPGRFGAVLLTLTASDGALQHHILLTVTVLSSRRPMAQLSAYPSSGISLCTPSVVLSAASSVSFSGELLVHSWRILDSPLPSWAVAINAQVAASAQSSITINASNWPAGETLEFEGTVRDSKGSHTSSLLISRSSADVPVIIPSGPTVIQATPAQTLYLRVNATASDCPAGLSTFSDISWVASDSGLTVGGALKTFASGRTLQIGEGSLQSCSTHNFTVTATASTGGTSSLDFTVSAIPDIVTISLEGGSERTVGHTQSVALRAITSATADDTVVFHWSCAAAAGTSACTAALTTSLSSDAAMQTGQVDLPAYTLGADTTIIISVQAAVVPPCGAAYNITSQQAINVVAGAPPLVSISTGLLQVADPSRVRIDAEVQAAEGRPQPQIEWSFGGETGNQSTADALSQASLFRSPRNAPSVALSLQPPQFVPGRSYVFRLTATDYDETGVSGLKSSSTVVVHIRSPPHGGLLTAAPAEGVSMSTSFRLTSSSWNVNTVDSLPLRHRFFSNETQFEALPLTANFVEKSTLDTILARSSDSTLLSLRVVVMDAFGASGSAWTAVHLTQPENPGLVLQNRLRRAEEQGDSNEVLLTVISGATLGAAASGPETAVAVDAVVRAASDLDRQEDTVEFISVAISVAVNSSDDQLTTDSGLQTLGLVDDLVPHILSSSAPVRSNSAVYISRAISTVLSLRFAIGSSSSQQENTTRQITVSALENAGVLACAQTAGSLSGEQASQFSSPQYSSVSYTFNSEEGTSLGALGDAVNPSNPPGIVVPALPSSMRKYSTLVAQAWASNPHSSSRDPASLQLASKVTTFSLYNSTCGLGAISGVGSGASNTSELMIDFPVDNQTANELLREKVAPITAAKILFCSADTIGTQIELDCPSLSSPLVARCGQNSSQARYAVRLACPRAVRSLRCAFWNTSTLSWSSDGCVSSSYGGGLHCTCSHLTDYAAEFQSTRQNLVATVNNIPNAFSPTRHCPHVVAKQLQVQLVAADAGWRGEDSAASLASSVHDAIGAVLGEAAAQRVVVSVSNDDLEELRTNASSNITLSIKVGSERQQRVDAEVMRAQDELNLLTSSEEFATVISDHVNTGSFPITISVPTDGSSPAQISPDAELCASFFSLLFTEYLPLTILVLFIYGSSILCCIGGRFCDIRAQLKRFKRAMGPREVGKETSGFKTQIPRMRVLAGRLHSLHLPGLHPHIKAIHNQDNSRDEAAKEGGIELHNMSNTADKVALMSAAHASPTMDPVQGHKACCLRPCRCGGRSCCSCICCHARVFNTYWTTLVQEHELVAIFLHEDQFYTRPQRVMVLLTILVTYMMVESVFFEQTVEAAATNGHASLSYIFAVAAATAASVPLSLVFRAMFEAIARSEKARYNIEKRGFLHFLANVHVKDASDVHELHSLPGPELVREGLLVIEGTPYYCSLERLDQFFCLSWYSSNFVEKRRGFLSISHETDIIEGKHQHLVRAHAVQNKRKRSKGLCNAFCCARKPEHHIRRVGSEVHEFQLVSGVRELRIRAGSKEDYDKWIACLKRITSNSTWTTTLKNLKDTVDTVHGFRQYLLHNPQRFAARSRSTLHLQADYWYSVLCEQLDALKHAHGRKDSHKVDKLLRQRQGPASMSCCVPLRLMCSRRRIRDKMRYIRKLAAMSDYQRRAALRHQRFRRRMCCLRAILYDLYDPDVQESRDEASDHHRFWSFVLWAFALSYVIFPIFYLVSFADRVGSSTTRRWVLSTCSGIALQLILFGPVRVFLLNTLLPSLVLAPLSVETREELEEEQKSDLMNSASSDLASTGTFEPDDLKELLPSSTHADLFSLLSPRLKRKFEFGSDLSETKIAAPTTLNQAAELLQSRRRHRVLMNNLLEELLRLSAEAESKEKADSRGGLGSQGVEPVGAEETQAPESVVIDLPDLPDLPLLAYSISDDILSCDSERLDLSLDFVQDAVGRYQEQIQAGKYLREPHLNDSGSEKKREEVVDGEVKSIPAERLRAALQIVLPIVDATSVGAHVNPEFEAEYAIRSVEWLEELYMSDSHKRPTPDLLRMLSTCCTPDTSILAEVSDPKWIHQAVDSGSSPSQLLVEVIAPKALILPSRLLYSLPPGLAVPTDAAMETKAGRFRFIWTLTLLVANQFHRMRIAFLIAQGQKSSSDPPAQLRAALSNATRAQLIISDNFLQRFDNERWPLSSYRHFVRAVKMLDEFSSPCRPISPQQPPPPLTDILAHASTMSRLSEYSQAAGEPV